MFGSFLLGCIVLGVGYTAQHTKNIEIILHELKTSLDSIKERLEPLREIEGELSDLASTITNHINP